VPEDLDHPDWQLHPLPRAARVTKRDRQPQAPIEEPDYTVVDLSTDSMDLTAEPQEANPDLAEDSEPESPAHLPTPADKVPAENSGPLSVIANRKRTGKTHAYRIHLLDTGGICTGCKWRPKPDQAEPLSLQDYTMEPDVYAKCLHCFKLHTFPTSWQPQAKAQPDTDSDSDSSAKSDSTLDTVTDDDTESEREALLLDST
jgi:hypothetical protein